jgi:hypothetical protein
MWTSPSVEIDFNILQSALPGNKRQNHHRGLIFDIISAGDSYKTKYDDARL